MHNSYLGKQKLIKKMYHTIYFPGVTRHVGDGLLLERSQRTGRVNTLGIAPWGIVENNQDLIGHNTEVPYHSISSPR